MKQLSLIFCIVLIVTSACKTQKEIVVEKEDNKVYETYELDKQPSYPGGEKAQAKFIRRYVTYPRLSLETGSQGKIYVSFIVEKDSTTSNHKIVRSFDDKACNDECIRVIKLMKFIPAIKNDKKVRAKLLLPIVFKLY